MLNRCALNWFGLFIGKTKFGSSDRHMRRYITIAIGEVIRQFG